MVVRSIPGPQSALGEHRSHTHTRTHSHAHTLARAHALRTRRCRADSALPPRSADSDAEWSSRRRRRGGGARSTTARGRRCAAGGVGTSTGRRAAWLGRISIPPPPPPPGVAPPPYRLASLPLDPGRRREWGPLGGRPRVSPRARRSCRLIRCVCSARTSAPRSPPTAASAIPWPQRLGARLSLPVAAIVGAIVAWEWIGPLPASASQPGAEEQNREWQRAGRCGPNYRNNV